MDLTKEQNLNIKLLFYKQGYAAKRVRKKVDREVA